MPQLYLKMSDGPDDGQEDGTTANEINEYKYFLPHSVTYETLI